MAKIDLIKLPYVTVDSSPSLLCSQWRATTPQHGSPLDLMSMPTVYHSDTVLSAEALDALAAGDIQIPIGSPMDLISARTVYHPEFILSPEP